MFAKLKDEDELAEDEDGNRDNLNKFMKDLEQMMDGMLDLYRR
jgi:hypothetical protein